MSRLIRNDSAQHVRRNDRRALNKLKENRIYDVSKIFLYTVNPVPYTFLFLLCLAQCLKNLVRCGRRINPFAYGVMNCRNHQMGVCKRMADAV